MTTPTTTNKTIDQQLTFDDQVIEKIAGITASKVPGIISLDGNLFSEMADKMSSGTNPTKGINADVGEKQVALKMEATLEYGASAPEVFREVCKEIDKELQKMTGLKLVKFELHINDVKTDKEVNN